MNIYPSILFNNGKEVEEWIKKAAETGKYERMQVDFINQPFGNHSVSVIETYPPNFKPIVFDAHIMTSKANIETEVWEARVVGYDRIIAQVESLENQQEYLKWVKQDIDKGKYKVGIGVDLDTDVSCIDASMHSALDVVLVMSVKAGKGGQKFETKVFEKIKKLDSLRRKNSFKFNICVDGGVEKELLPELERLGVDEVVVGVKRLLQW